MPRKIPVPESHPIKSTLMEQRRLDRLFPGEKPVAITHVSLDLAATVVRDIADERQMEKQRPSGFDVVEGEPDGVVAGHFNIYRKAADDLFDHIRTGPVQTSQGLESAKEAFYTQPVSRTGIEGVHVFIVPELAGPACLISVFKSVEHDCVGGFVKIIGAV